MTDLRGVSMLILVLTSPAAGYEKGFVAGDSSLELLRTPTIPPLNAV